MDSYHTSSRDGKDTIFAVLITWLAEPAIVQVCNRFEIRPLSTCANWVGGRVEPLGVLDQW